MRGRYPSTRRAPAIGGRELERVAAADLAAVLAIAPALPAGLVDWWAPRWNVAPTQPVRAITARSGEPRLTLARWGLTLPSHAAKRPQVADVPAELAVDKPFFRNALGKRRGLVIADGFYAWRRGESGASRESRAPVRFAPGPDGPDGDAPVVTFAAIARGRQHDGAWLEELALLTTAADALVAPVDDRRPVVIAAADRARWLDHAVTADELIPLLAPAPLTGWSATDAPAWLASTRLEHAAAQPPPPAQGSLF